MTSEFVECLPVIMIHPLNWIFIIANMDFPKFETIFIMTSSNTTAKTCTTLITWTISLAEVILPVFRIVVFISLTMMVILFPLIVLWICAINILVSTVSQSNKFTISQSNFWLHSFKGFPCVPFLLTPIIYLSPPIRYWPRSIIITNCSLLN